MLSAASGGWAFRFIPYLRPLFCRHYRSDLPQPIRRILSGVPRRHRRRAIREAQQALTEHLHTTRSIQFAFAEKISSNSVYALSSLISKIPHFSLRTFSESFAKLLRYQRMNELEFFYESIGIYYKDVPFFLPAGQFFLTQDFKAFSVACELSGFGFPWNRLGNLYRDEVWIFSQEPKSLSDMLMSLKNSSGFSSVVVTGMCLACPQLLRCKPEMGDTGLLVDYLKMVVDFAIDAQQDLDFWHGVTSVLKVIYDVGIERGDVQGLMEKCRNVFFGHSVEFLVNRVDYFCKLGVDKKDVVMLLLERPEIGCFESEVSEFSVTGVLKHFGMNEANLESVKEKYPYVMGRNKMANLPCVMRALDLHNWFLKQLKNGSPQLLSSYVLDDANEDIDGLYGYELKNILNSRSHVETMSKLNFLHGIGFGENKVTMKVLSHLHNSSTAIEESFNSYLDLGADYSKLCDSITRWPQLLRPDMDVFMEMLDFFVNEMGLSWSDFYNNPQCFSLDFERRIKPRCRFYELLAEKGLATKAYPLSQKVKPNEKSFIAHVFSIHPAAPKHYLEHFAFRKPSSVA